MLKKFLKALFTLQLCITPAHCCLSLEGSQLKKYQVGCIVTQLGEGTAWGWLRKEMGWGSPRHRTVSLSGRQEIKPVRCFPNLLYQETHLLNCLGQFLPVGNLDTHGQENKKLRLCNQKWICVLAPMLTS